MSDAVEGFCRAALDCEDSVDTVRECIDRIVEDSDSSAYSIECLDAYSELFDCMTENGHCYEAELGGNYYEIFGDPDASCTDEENEAEELCN